MADVQVIVPFQGDDPHRLAALHWVTSRLFARYPEWTITMTDLGDGPWSKARAVEPAHRDSTADVVVVHDCDVWAPDRPDGVDPLAAAVDTVVSGRRKWAQPHYTVHRLTEDDSARVIDGTLVDPRQGRLERRAYTGTAGGGIVVVSREVYERVPLDPRFEGWGHEDASWARALSTMVGPRGCAHGELFHLWHPPQQPRDQVNGSAGSVALRQRYVGAQGRFDPMHALLGEAREALGRACYGVEL